MTAPNQHATKPSGERVPPGRCAYEMSSSRLGTTWHLCEKPAQMRCTIRHGAEERVEDYCTRHYRNAMRRTRYDVVLDSAPIPGRL